MRIAFYAPLKPPDHPVPSGDRRMAALLGLALARAGHEVELAARLRSYDGAGDIGRQARIAAIGSKLAARLVESMRARAPSQRPRAWLTYHLYYKAPDWIGPRVAVQLGIPYLVVEASVAAKRAGGPWSLGHEAVLAALKRADAAISLNPADDACVAPYLRDANRLRRLRPFLDAGPFFEARRQSQMRRPAVARRFDLDPAIPWLVTAAMMRPGDKLASYRVLGEALATQLGQRWQLLVIGDGSARADVEAALTPLGARAKYAGLLPPEALPETLAAADLFVWPAVNEAWGMAILEAHAAGLPVVAGRSGGVATLVADGQTGTLVRAGDAAAFAAAVADFMDDPGRRQAYGDRALAKVAAEHDIAAAAATLDVILDGATTVRA